jgi:hypothetical protein
LPSPAVTSRPPGAKLLSRDAPRCPLDRVTQGDSSDTYRRIVRDSEIVPRDLSLRVSRDAPWPAGSSAPSEAAHGYHADTIGNVPCSNRDINAHCRAISRATVRQRRGYGRGRGRTVRRGEARATDRRRHQRPKPGTVIPVRKAGGRRAPQGGSAAALCVSRSGWIGQGRGRRASAAEASWGRTGSGRSRGSSQWGAAEPRPSRLR